MSNVSHELEQLPNGSQLCFVNVANVDVVRMQIEFDRAGHMYSPDGLYETAHLTEHMIFSGSKRHPNRRDFYDAVSSNGAVTNAETHEDRMEYHLVTPQHGADEAVSTYLNAIEEPLFSQEALEVDRQVVQEEISEKLGKVVFWALVYESIGLPTEDLMDRMNTVGSITPQHLHQHHQDTHTLDTMTAVITGSLSDKDKNHYASMLQDLSLQPTASNTQTAFNLKQPNQIVQQPIVGATSATYWLSKYGVESSSYEDTLAHEVAFNLLYTYPRSTIEAAARDKGLVYNVSGGWDIGWHGGYDFMIGGTVSPANAPKLCSLVRTALANVLDLSDEATLEHLKKYTIGSRQVRMSELKNIHADAADQLRRFGKVASPLQVQDELQKLDVQSFRDSVRRGLRGGTTAGAVFGDEQTIEDSTIISEFQKTFDYLAGL